VEHHAGGGPKSVTVKAADHFFVLHLNEPVAVISVWLHRATSWAFEFLKWMMYVKLVNSLPG
jgi:hypothetical protein